MHKTIVAAAAVPGPYKVTSEGAFYGARHNAGHTATVFHPGGGEYANVASNWLVGGNRGLCTDSNRDVRSKGLKQ